VGSDVPGARQSDRQAGDSKIAIRHIRKSLGSINEEEKDFTLAKSLEILEEPKPKRY
jgi:hypothetical protein